MGIHGLPDGIELGPRLGRGRQAVVHEATHPRHGRVALKLMEGRSGLPGERSLRRFMREASLAQRVSHPNVLRILEAGEVDFGAYLVMELLTGLDLAHVLERSGPLPVEALVEVGRQTGEGLQALDREGVLHRDLKPENLFAHFGPEGVRIVLTDFGVGIARSGDGASRMTGSGMFVGTASYLPPEVGQAGELDIRADIYAIGIMLFVMATGKVPFHGSFRRSLDSKRKDAPPRLVELGFPELLSNVVETAMAPNPDHRFDTPIALARALVETQHALGLPTGDEAFHNVPLHPAPRD